MKEKGAVHEQQRNSSMARGIICALVGASLWGFSGSCTQFLFAHYEIDALFITAVRMLGSGILFLAVLAMTHRSEIHAMLHDRKTRRELVIFGAIGLFLAQVTYIVVIGYTNAGTATVLQALNIVIVMFATCIIVKRAPKFLELAGFVLAMIATVLIATKGDLSTLAIPPLGLIWGLINAASVAFYIMYPKKLFDRWPSLPVVGLGMFIGGISTWLLWGASAILHHVTSGAIPALATFPSLTMPGYIVLAAIVLVGTFAAFGLYLYGVSIVGGVKGSLLGAIEPVSATVVSALWLGTMFTWADWIGLILMVATIFLVTLQNNSRA